MIFVNTAKAEIKPIDYNFTFEKFSSIMPGKKISEIDPKYKLTLINNTNNVLLYKFEVVHQQYHFPVFVQIKNDIIIDFMARLPSYFLHDVFHQSLINRYGKQDKFTSRNNHSFYYWENKNDMNITYNGACTITCFPIFLHMISAKEQTLLKESLLTKLQNGQI